MFRTTSITVLFLILGGSAVAQWTLPPLAARTLSDHEFTVPANLPERASLLIIGFTKASRTQTSAWSRELAQDDSLQELVATFQAAVIEDVPAMMQRFVVRGIRRGVPEPLHDHFLIVTTGSDDWKALASYSDSAPNGAYLVLLDKQHEIRWRESGEPDATSVEALRSVAAELQETP